MADEIALKSELLECTAKVRDLESIVAELKDFIENATVPLHWVNGSGIIIWANKEELDFMGYTKEEYVGKHISNFHADKDVIEDLLSLLINKQIVKNFPAQLLLKSGEIKPVLINSSVYRIDDKFIHTRCFTRDVSELKKAEEIKIEVITELHRQNKLLKDRIAILEKQK